MVLAISSFLTSSFLPIRSYLLVWSLHILLALKLDELLSDPDGIRVDVRWILFVESRADLSIKQNTNRIIMFMPIKSTYSYILCGIKLIGNYLLLSFHLQKRDSRTLLSFSTSEAPCRPYVLHVLRLFDGHTSQPCGGFQVSKEPLPSASRLLWTLGDPSPWLQTGNSRWVTWPASHLLCTPFPSTPWEATPPSTCWPTAACLGDLGLTCPKRWLLSVSHFHYSVCLCLTCLSSHFPSQFQVCIRPLLYF